ncbi:MAG TPA: hypothetical protein VF768_12295 [Holophagaceae bacterium]
MITPLVQRQILQTAAVETVRLASEGAAQVQQEMARRQSFDAKLAEARADVADVETADALRLTEREGRGGRGGAPHGEESEGGEASQADSAEGAGPHLDLLA